MSNALAPTYSVDFGYSRIDRVAEGGRSSSALISADSKGRSKSSQATISNGGVGVALNIDGSDLTLGFLAETDGRLDLSTEKLNAKFHTQARKRLGIGMSDLATPFVEIGGTLASPRLQLDSVDTLVRGGAAIATVGLSFLAKKANDRLFSDRNPCRTAVRLADEDLSSRK